MKQLTLCAIDLEEFGRIIGREIKPDDTAVPFINTAVTLARETYEQGRRGEEFNLRAPYKLLQAYVRGTEQ